MNKAFFFSFRRKKPSIMTHDIPVPDTTFDDLSLYDRAARELEDGTPDKGLYTKAFVETDGDETKAKVYYLKWRVQMLKDEAQQSAPKTNKRHWDRWLARTNEQTLTALEELMVQIQDFDPELSAEYSDSYIGIRNDPYSPYFLTFVLKGNNIRMTISVPPSKNYLNSVRCFCFGNKKEKTRLNITIEELQTNKSTIISTLKQAYADYKNPTVIAISETSYPATADKQSKSKKHKKSRSLKANYNTKKNAHQSPNNPDIST